MWRWCVVSLLEPLTPGNKSLVIDEDDSSFWNNEKQSFTQTSNNYCQIEKTNKATARALNISFSYIYCVGMCRNLQPKAKNKDRTMNALHFSHHRVQAVFVSSACRWIIELFVRRKRSRAGPTGCAFSLSPGWKQDNTMCVTFASFDEDVVDRVTLPPPTLIARIIGMAKVQKECNKWLDVN